MIRRKSADHGSQVGRVRLLYIGESLTGEDWSGAREDNLLSRWLGCFTVDWQLACFPALDFKRLCNYLLLRTALWSLIFNLTKRCLEPGASAEVKLARSLKSIDNLFIQKFYLFKNLKPEILIILIHSNICANLKTSVGFIFDSDMFFFWSNQLRIQINLVIFTSKTFVEFVVYIFLQPQLLEIHLYPATLLLRFTILCTSHTQISTNFDHSKVFKTHRHASLRTIPNINASHQWHHGHRYSKYTIHYFQSRID